MLCRKLIIFITNIKRKMCVCLFKCTCFCAYVSVCLCIHEPMFVWVCCFLYE